VNDISHTTEHPAPSDVLGVATIAARRAGADLLARFDRPPDGVEAKSGPADLVSEADRAAEAIIARILADRRPDDGLLGEEGVSNRAGTSGLRWVVDPLDGTGNYLIGVPLWCVSIACEDADGTVAGVVFDPVRDELFAAARGLPAMLNGVVIQRADRSPLPAATITGTISCTTEPEARRHGKLGKRLYRKLGHRRSLGTAALELAWTAAGRLDLCFHEQHIHAWDVDAGLFICQRAGLRVHRLPPLEEGLAPRFLAAPAGLAGEVLPLVGPSAKARRKAARAELTAAGVREAMRRRTG
jgi:myo-inositol-1(or 4)-monophosphatase